MTTMKKPSPFVGRRAGVELGLPERCIVGNPIFGVGLERHSKLLQVVLFLDHTLDHVASFVDLEGVS